MGRNRSAFLGIENNTPVPAEPSLTLVQSELKAALEQPEPSTTPEPAPAPVTPQPRTGMGWNVSQAKSANAVGAVGSALGNLRGQTSAEIAALKSQLESGDTVVELDTDKIDGSFVSDRMERSDEATDTLVEQIRNRGQLVPILVRPNPADPARYQVAFGHRRLAAAKKLGIAVRAVVRNLTDEELVIAQGQENNARLDLSYIEKALFAVKLEESGFNRNVIGAALAASKSELSRLIAVGTKIPRSIIMAIGAAPGIGRTRWNDLLELFKEHKSLDRATDIISKPDFQDLSSDERFTTLVAKLAKKERVEPSQPQPQIFLKDAHGRRVARITDSDDRVAIQIDKTVSSKFGAFLVSRIEQLFREFEEANPST
jgi:ParB family transcriptional regulator, chromosome partitioning protein